MQKRNSEMLQNYQSSNSKYVLDGALEIEKCVANAGPDSEMELD